MNDFSHKAEAGYQVAKLTSDAMKSIRETLIGAGAAPDVVEICLHHAYTLAYLDGLGAGLTVAREAMR